MDRRLLKANIDRAWHDILRLVESNTEAERMFIEATNVAEAQEREHRAFGRRLVGHISRRGSVQTSARYFAARAVLDVVTTRRDALGAAVREWLLANKPSRFAVLTAEHAGCILGIDYARDIAGRNG